MPPAVHRQALCPVPPGEGAGPQAPLPGSALNPLLQLICAVFSTEDLCSLKATQGTQGRVGSAAKGWWRRLPLRHHRPCSKWPFHQGSRPEAPGHFLLFTWVLLPSTQLLSSPLFGCVCMCTSVCTCVYLVCMCVSVCAPVCIV